MNRKTLTLPSQPDTVHPLHKKLRLLMFNLSGDTLRVRVFKSQLPTLSSSPGDQVQTNSMLRILRNGTGTVVHGTLIHFHPL